MGKQTNNNVTNEAEVAHYLENNPLFFSKHSALLASMHLPSPHGSGTVSLAERQQAAQRDKIYQIEQKYNELLRFGIENDEKSNKVHSLTLALLNASNLTDILNAVNKNLKNDFDISSTKVILWAEPKNNDDASHVAFDEIDGISKAWAEALIEPYCGALPNVNLSSIKINDEVKSYAITPLEIGTPVGLLVMASIDEKRFYPDMGTVFVKRIGELLSAALSQHLV
jgi:uncharacterized protein YigA (DUF484 family)